jgi:hypothetical protein
MAQMYEIPRLNTASPLAGIAQLYATYKGIERQKEQDAYTEKKDAKTFGLKEQELAAQRDYQQRSLDQNDPIAMQRKAYQIINDPNSTQGEIAAAQNMYGTLTYMMDPTRKVERDQQMKGLWQQMFGRTSASPLAGLGSGIGALPYDEQQLPPGAG